MIRVIAALSSIMAVIGWVLFWQAKSAADYNWMLYEYWVAQADTAWMWSNRHAKVWSIQRDSNHTCQRMLLR